MQELILVRHAFAGSNRDGSASCSVPGEGLTPEGVEQARAVAAVLAGEELSLGASSRLARTKRRALVSSSSISITNTRAAAKARRTGGRKSSARGSSRCSVPNR